MNKLWVFHHDAGHRLQQDMDTLAATVFTMLGPRGHSLAFGKMKEILASLFVIGFCLFAWAALILALLSLC